MTENASKNPSECYSEAFNILNLFVLDLICYIKDVLRQIVSFQNKQYYDIHIKTSADVFVLVRVIKKSNPSVQRTIFVDILKAGKAVRFVKINQNVYFYNSFRGITIVEVNDVLDFKPSEGTVRFLR